VIGPHFPKWRDTIARIGAGLTVSPEDPGEIAAAILRILTHPEEAKEMGRKGREAVEREFNWQAEERKLVELYAQILSPRCRGSGRNGI
jgi:glycosyltransferase involved in cell wall biosynthesis